MKQNRTDRDAMPNRSSNMEPAEGSRDTATTSEELTGMEAMRNREEGSRDLGSSSDRAMFDEDSPEPRSTGDEVRGQGSSGERSRDNAGGISNRPLDREQAEQEQLPDRGRSDSER